MVTKPSSGYKELLNYNNHLNQHHHQQQQHQQHQQQQHESGLINHSPNSMSPPITSTNNSPLLKRLQVNKIKHLLSVKSRIFPVINNKDNSGQHQDSDLLLISNCDNSTTAHSLPNSPLHKRWLFKSKQLISPASQTANNSPVHNIYHNNSSTPTTEFNPSTLRFSDPSLHKRLKHRVCSAFNLPNASLNTNSIKIASKCAIKNVGETNYNAYINDEEKISCSEWKKDPKTTDHIHIRKHSNQDINEIDIQAELEAVAGPSLLNEWPTSYHPIDEIRDVVLVREDNKRFGIKLDRTSCGEQITYIVMILPGSVAQKAGLKIGDQIVRVDSFYVHQIGMEDLVDYIRAKPDAVRIFFKARSLLVRTKVIQVKKEDNRFGLRLIRRIQGVFVDYVIPESPAAKAQLQPGDQLLKINNIDVSHWSQEKATHLLKHSGTQCLTLHVYDATFAANDCLHKKNIFFDCNDTNNDTIVDDEDNDDGMEDDVENSQHKSELHEDSSNVRLDVYKPNNSQSPNDTTLDRIPTNMEETNSQLSINSKRYSGAEWKNHC